MFSVLLKSPPFPLSAMTRLYSSAVYNALLILLFFGGIGVVAVIIQPPAVRNAYGPELYVVPIGGLLFIALLVSGLILTMSQFAKQRERRLILNLTQGDGLLAVWQYAPDEWQQLAALQSASEKRGFGLWGSLIVILLIAGFFGYLSFASDMPAAARTAYWPIGIFIVVFMVVASIGGRIQRQMVGQQNNRRRMANGAPRIYIGQKGIYHETEGVLRWSKLLGFSVREGGVYPELLVRARFPGGRGGSTYAYSVPMAIPIQNLPDAQLLAHRFAATANVWV